MVPFQPNNINCVSVPGPLHACRDSRAEAKKVFTLLESSQPTFPFRLWVNFDQDVVYLNQNFRNPKKSCDPSGIHGEINLYEDHLKNVKQLAMNIGEMFKLTTAYRDPSGKYDLWAMLQKHCPELEIIVTVLDGPIRESQSEKKIQFRRLFPYQNAELPRSDFVAEFTRRHTKFSHVMISFREAQQKDRCSLDRLPILVSIDQEKRLPIKDGEKENMEGQDQKYDAYGLSDVKQSRRDDIERNCLLSA